jgi:hypothetical protein
MKNRTVILAACLASLGCGSDDSNNPEAVGKAFEEYRNAILNCQGAKAAELVNRHTIDGYQKYLDLSRKAPRQIVQALPIGDKLMVLSLRHRVPKEQLRKMDGRAVFIHAVNSGWIGKAGVEALTTGEAEITDGRAELTTYGRDKKTPQKFLFTKEDGLWKTDLIQVMEANKDAFRTIAIMGRTEDEAICNVIAIVSGEEVTDSIWDPVGE